MENINVSEFRANLLKYLKKAKNGQQIIVTSNGETLATIVPPINQQNEAQKALKKLAKTAVIKDITSPTNESWDALQ